MKPLILIVEDDKKISYNMKLILEFANYEVVSVTNGIDGLKTLLELNRIPDVILSDIIMPKMNGYDFFTKVSLNPLWSHIPFVFVSSKSSRDDIRFGKMLGVDDYLTKPFEEEDLLAIVEGKIVRLRKVKNANKKIIEMISLLALEKSKVDFEDVDKDVILMYIIRDDKLGPSLKEVYPKDVELSLDISELGNILFQSVNSLYSHDDIYEAEGILLNLDEVHRKGFVFLDSTHGADNKGGEIKFMLAVVAPQISYLESMKIKEILMKLSRIIKKRESWNIISFWEKIYNVFLNPYS